MMDAVTKSTCRPQVIDVRPGGLRWPLGTVRAAAATWAPGAAGVARKPHDGRDSSWAWRRAL
jgi:hypothetical protein